MELMCFCKKYWPNNSRKSVEFLEIILFPFFKVNIVRTYMCLRVTRKTLQLPFFFSSFSFFFSIRFLEKFFIDVLSFVILDVCDQDWPWFLGHTDKYLSKDAGGQYLLDLCFARVLWIWVCLYILPFFISGFFSGLTL